MLEAIAIELENDADLKEIMMLEAWRVRKDNRDVLVSQGFHRFAEVVDGILVEMKGPRSGPLRCEPAGGALGLYGHGGRFVPRPGCGEPLGVHRQLQFGGRQKVLDVLVPAFRGEQAHSLKAVNE